MKNRLIAAVIGLMAVWLVINTVQISQLQADLTSVSEAKNSSQRSRAHREKVVGQARTSATYERSDEGRRPHHSRNNGDDQNHLNSSEDANSDPNSATEEERIRKLVADETRREMNQRTERWQEMARQRMTERLNEFTASYDLNDEDSTTLHDVVGGYMEERMSSHWSVMEGDITRDQAKEELAIAKADTQDAVIELIGEDGLNELSEKLGHRMDLGKE